MPVTPSLEECGPGEPAANILPAMPVFRALPVGAPSRSTAQSRARDFVCQMAPRCDTRVNRVTCALAVAVIIANAGIQSGDRAFLLVG